MIGCGNACFGRMGSIDPLNLNILVLVFIPRGFKQTSRIFITHLKENLGFQVEEDCNDCHVCDNQDDVDNEENAKNARGRPEYEDIEDCKEGERDEVEEDEVHPGDVDLNVVRILANM